MLLVLVRDDVPGFNDWSRGRSMGGVLMRQLTLSYFARFDSEDVGEQTTIDEWGDNESLTADGGTVREEGTR